MAIYVKVQIDADVKMESIKLFTGKAYMFMIWRFL